jgi:RNA polymerase sigma-70 factor (ECF subfamily)
MAYESRPPISAFEELALPVFDSLYNFARWLTLDRNDAEDLVQETYLKALRGFASFQAGTNFRAWMFKILKNSFLSSRSTLDSRMSVPMEPELDSAHSPTTFMTPEAALITNFGVEAILDAIMQLPITFREVILLRDVEGWSYREMAEILGIPAGTVMSRLARARKMVRESIDQAHSASLGSGSASSGREVLRYDAFQRTTLPQTSASVYSNLNSFARSSISAVLASPITK